MLSAEKKDFGISKFEVYDLFFDLILGLIIGARLGCAAILFRQVVKVDLNLHVGKIEGNQFTGIRYPMQRARPPTGECSIMEAFKSKNF